MIIGLSGQAGSGKDTVADFLVEHHGFVKVALADPIKRAAMEWWDFTENQLWGPSSERNKPDRRYRVRDYAALKPEFVGKMPTLEESRERAREAAPELEAKMYLTPRHALQQIGTEVARAIDPDVWVRYTMRIARWLLATPGAGYVKVSGAFRRKDQYGEYLDGQSFKVKGVVISDCRFKNEFKAVKENGYIVRIKRPNAGLEGQQAQHASEAEQREVPDDYFDHIIDNEGDTLHNLKLRVDSMMDAITGRMKKYDANGNDDIPPFKRT